MLINLNHIIENSRVQGPGERFTIWVQGCSIHCNGCCNKDTWNFDLGEKVFVDALIDRVLASTTPSLTITGGEPLDQLDAILELSKSVFASKDIFLCSGYDLDSIRKCDKKKQILETIDILCSGPFVEEQKCESEWKGSRNQEVIFLTPRGQTLLNLPVFKREYRIDKKTGKTLITGFSLC